MNGAEKMPRPLYWSVRREIWENRSIYLAPLIVAGIVFFSIFVGLFSMPKRMSNLPTDPAARHLAIVKPYSMAPAPIMFATLLVGLYYALDCLYGERRDRSILFWKSLPVSDGTTVLAKMLIPFVVLPAIAFVLSVIAQVLLLAAGTMILAASGGSPGTLWSEFQYPQEPVVMLYGLTVHALWFAPVYGWLMLVSAWARRAPFLWATIPLLVSIAVERIVFNSTHFGNMLKSRFIGAMGVAFTADGQKLGIDRLSHLSPIRFLSTPGLWIGFLFAAVFFTAAVRLRRRHEPI